MIVEPDDAIELLRGLVAIESVSGNEAEAVAYLVEQFESLGYGRAYVDAAGNAIGIRQNSDDAQIERTIILLGHIDTVPGRIPVRMDQGVLHGRGSVDAKGPLATFAVAGAQAPIAPGTRLVVAGAVEEESASSKGARQIARDFRADICIIGEPSSAQAITLGYKGRLLVDVEIVVDEGHTAGPLPSAAELIADYWQGIAQYAREFNTDRQRLFDQLLPSLRRIQSSSDGLRGRGEARIGLRLPPEFDLGGFESFLNEPFQSGKMAGSVATSGYESAHRSNRSNELVRAFQRSFADANVRLGFKLKTGTSDMNVVAPVWNCPIVAFGPGDSSLDHTPDEHVHLDEYAQCIRLLTNALIHLQGG